MQNNPYEAPNTTIMPEKYDIALATRSQRLGSAIIDMIIGIIISIPLWVMIGFESLIRANQSFAIGTLLLSLGYGLVVTLLVHGYFLHQNGQTIGKKMMAIRIADMQGQVPPLPKIFLLRILPVTCVAFVPGIGALLSLIDILFIFRKDKRCIHDLIADTQVLKA